MSPSHDSRPSLAGRRSPSRDKFRELILYVARETEGDAKCGATKLNKILFYADFLAFRELGSSISGQAYQKLDFGPAPRGIVPAVEAMERGGECAWALRSYHGLELKKLIPLREPDLGEFTGEEVALVQRVLRQLEGLNATQVSDLSHEFAGWKAAEPGEDIPYETVFVGEPRPLTSEEHGWALEAIDRFDAERTA